MAALKHVRDGTFKADLLKRHGQVLGLKDINVDMRQGEITVIMGLSGSGKSTLIRHINRLIEPTAGQIEVDGENVLAYGEEQLRNLRRQVMSRVFQKFALLSHRDDWRFRLRMPSRAAAVRQLLNLGLRVAHHEANSALRSQDFGLLSDASERKSD